MKRYYLCPIILVTDADGNESYQSSVAFTKTGGGRNTNIPIDPVTGIPLFNYCVVVAYGDEALVNALESESAKDILTMNRSDLHAKLAEGRNRTFQIRLFPESSDPVQVLTQALQQQHRTATADKLGVR